MSDKFTPAEMELLSSVLWSALHDPRVAHCGSYYEPIGHSYDRGGYVLSMGTDGFGIFVLRSPFTTRAAFCSPCAPGAGNLDSPCDDGIETYCLGPEWFEGEIAPYPCNAIATRLEVTSV